MHYVQFHVRTGSQKRRTEALAQSTSACSLASRAGSGGDATVVTIVSCDCHPQASVTRCVCRPWHRSRRSSRLRCRPRA